MSVNAGENVVGVYVGEELLTGSGLPESFTTTFDTQSQLSNESSTIMIDTLGYKFLDVSITSSTNGGVIQGSTTDGWVNAVSFNAGASQSSNVDISAYAKVRTNFSRGSDNQTGVNSGAITLHN